MKWGSCVFRHLTGIRRTTAERIFVVAPGTDGDAAVSIAGEGDKWQTADDTHAHTHTWSSHAIHIQETAQLALCFAASLKSD